MSRKRNDYQDESEDNLSKLGAKAKIMMTKQLNNYDGVLSQLDRKDEIHLEDMDNDSKAQWSPPKLDYLDLENLTDVLSVINQHSFQLEEFEDFLPDLITTTVEKKNSAKGNRKEKGMQGKGACRPLLRKTEQEKRDEVNKRERNRNRAFASAYKRLKEKLPNNTNIKTKKEIICQAIIRIKDLGSELIRKGKKVNT